jgi:solute:Na+ symporter, SSS family
MNNPVFFIGIYFLLVLSVGLCSFFRVKTSSDYYIAGKKAGLMMVSGSLLATILGGSAILGTLELSQKTGWPAIWFLFCASFGLFALAPLARYVSRYAKYTLPELLGYFFGKNAQFIASIIIPIAWLGIIAAQIIAAGKIVSGLEIIDYYWSAIISGTIFILYTLLGGQVSILKTDLLQSLFIIAGLATLTIFTVNSDFNSGMPSFSAGALFNESFDWLDLIILIMTYSVTFVVGPDIYSRIFCARNEKIATRSIIIVALALIPVSVILVYLGIYSGYSGETEIVRFASGILPGWFYGLFLAALLSGVMSSADTTLLTSSLILSELIDKNLESNRSLAITRLLIVTFGILSILISLYVTSILQSLLLALTFFSGAFVLPMLAGLLNIPVVRQQLMFAIITGGLIALAGKIINLQGYPTAGNMVIIMSFFVNSGLMFINFKKISSKILMKCVKTR